MLKERNNTVKSISCSNKGTYLDTIQKMMLCEKGEDNHIPCILYPQLLGLSLGIDSDALGLEMNQIEIKEIEGFLTSG